MSVELAKLTAAKPDPLQRSLHDANSGDIISTFYTKRYIFLTSCNYYAYPTCNTSSGTTTMTLKSSEVDVCRNVAIGLTINHVTVKNPDKYRVRWPKRLAYQCVSSCSLKFGTGVKEYLSCEWCDYFHERFIKEEELLEYNMLIGNTPQMTTWSSSLPSADLRMIPPFFFNISDHTPLFVKEIVAQEKSVSIVFKTLDNVYEKLLQVQEQVDGEWVDRFFGPKGLKLEDVIYVPSIDLRPVPMIRANQRSMDEYDGLVCTARESNPEAIISYYINQINDISLENPIRAGDAISVSLKTDKECKAIVWCAYPVDKVEGERRLYSTYTSELDDKGENPTVEARLSFGSNDEVVFKSVDTELLIPRMMKMSCASTAGFNIISFTSNIFTADCDVGYVFKDTATLIISTRKSATITHYRFKIWLICNQSISIKHSLLETMNMKSKHEEEEEDTE